MSQEAQEGLSPLRRALLALQQMQSKLDAVREREREPIAVIGFGCRLPGGVSDADSYWRLLRDGVDAVTEVPADRWDKDAYYDPDPQVPGKMVTRWGGFLSDVRAFDPAFFSIAPREAVGMDPQQRLLLEVAAETFQHGGQPASRLLGSKTGTFVGISTHDYSELQMMSGGVAAADAYSGTGNAFSVASGRISYVFGLEGPSIALDTACSSSLVAVHLACQSLRLGESDMAIAGGTNLMLSPLSSVAMSKLGALSPDGRCRTFDASASGYVRAEGCGLVLLKRLRDAERDGDDIWALIRGSAVNQDGRSGGLTVPNGPAQEAVIREALARANVDPATVSYVEAHGTATLLGDPIEVEALCRVLGSGRGADRPLLIGSVKTNFGHAESAAGVAGLIKVILSLRHRRIPAHLHFRALNPHVPLGGVPVRVPTRTIDWEVGGSRIAGVSAFGFSGTNAHVVVEEAPPRPTSEGAPAAAIHVVPLSARDDDALRELSASTAAWIASETVDLGDLVYSAWNRREHHRHRVVVIGRGRSELARALHAHATREPSAGLESGVAPVARPKLAFVFSGQGSQWQGMGARLFDTEPAFRESVERCAEIMRGLLEHDDIRGLLREPLPEPLWRRASVVQPLIFTMQVSLAALLRSWGITADAVIGHSMGEVAAAHVAGALSLEDAARIICLRSRLVERASGGRMALVECSIADAEEALRPFEGRVSLAAANGPDNVLVAGDAAPVMDLVQSLTERGIFCRALEVDYASHSPHMDPLLGEIRTSLQAICPSPAAIRMMSTVTATPVEGPELDAEYWARNLRSQVLFYPALERLAREGHQVFVELSPHGVLTHSVERVLTQGVHQGVALAVMRRDRDPVQEIHTAAARLHAHGIPFEAPWQRPEGARATALPPHPWRKERFWVEAVRERPARVAGGHPLLGRALWLAGDKESVVFEADVDVRRLPLLADHRVEDAIVLPAAAYVEMGLSAGTTVAQGRPCSVEALSLSEAMVFANETVRTVQVNVLRASADELSFRVASRVDDGPWTVHGRGRLRLGNVAKASYEELAVARARCLRESSADVFYERLSERGLVYGPSFQGVRRVWFGEREAVAEIRRPAAGRWVLDPTLLDACFQVLGAAGEEAELAGPAVPVAIGSVRVHRAPTSDVFAHVRVVSIDARQVEGDVLVFDGEGHLLVEVRGLRAQALERPARAVDDRFVAHEWRERPPLAETAALAGSYLLFADHGGLATGLQLALERLGAKVDTVLPGAFLPSMLKGKTAVVQLSSCDCPSGERTDVAALTEARTRDLGAVLALVKAIARDGSRDTPRYWLVTRGACAVGREEVSLAQAPLWGLGRTIAHEHPELEHTRIDLAAGGASTSDDVEALVRELASEVREEEIALRERARFVGRIVRREPKPRVRETLALASGRPFLLRIDQPGVLDRLALAPLGRRAPGPDEVEIEVELASINFIDVLKAMGVYPGQESGPPALGGECAGRILACGDAVRGLQRGDEVVALAAGAISTHVTTAARYVVRRPGVMRAEDAAGIPTVFMTAWIALHHLARLKKGETILIHSAAGGTGLAALEIARRVGAEVYATAGSEEKRAFLASRGVRGVMDSRSLAFADEIMDQTGGRGVDVVLNSLAGEAIERGFSALAPYGRFVELGKRDIYEDASLRLGHFKKRLSYFAFDLAAMTIDRPDEVESVLREVIAAFADGALAPVPSTVVPISRAADAFRSMAQGHHVGKLVIGVRDPEAKLTVPVEAQGGLDGTILITGGLGGLGLSVARAFVSAGARSLVLLGRRGVCTTEQAQAVASLQSAGAEIVVAEADVSNPRALAHVLDGIGARGSKLSGVVHAAGVLADGVLIDQSLDRFEQVMASKMEGALNLHLLTKDMPLGFFVLYSSAASLFGSPGQGNYAAANAFLDALAHHRRALGLPALSINWGAFSEVGLAAAREDRRPPRQGLRNLTPAEGNDVLAQLLRSDETQIGVVPIDIRQWVSFRPRMASSLLFSELLDAARTARPEPGDRALIARLVAAPDAERRALLEEHIVRQVAEVVRMDRTRIDPMSPFKMLGVDSLMGLELRSRLEASLGVRLSATLIWTYANAYALAGHLATKLVAPAPAAPSATDRANARAPVSSESVEPAPSGNGEIAHRLAARLAALKDRLR